MPRDRKSTRADPRDAIRRDRSRLERRETGLRSFWRSVSVIGMVGWPIAVGSVGGTLLGRHLDIRYEMGARWTLSLMLTGMTIGCFAAWITVTQKHD